MTARLRKGLATLAVAGAVIGGGAAIADAATGGSGSDATTTTATTPAAARRRRRRRRRRRAARPAIAPTCDRRATGPARPDDRPRRPGERRPGGVVFANGRRGAPRRFPATLRTCRCTGSRSSSSFGPPRPEQEVLFRARAGSAGLPLAAKPAPADRTARLPCDRAREAPPRRRDARCGRAACRGSRRRQRAVSPDALRLASPAAWDSRPLGSASTAPHSTSASQIATAPASLRCGFASRLTISYAASSKKSSARLCAASRSCNSERP